MVDSLPWVGALVYLVWRADLRAQQWIAAKYRIPVDVPVTSATRPALATIVLPDDLVAVANQESEGWAREEAQQIMRTKFVEYTELTKGSADEVWQMVRSAVGVASMP